MAACGWFTIESGQAVAAVVYLYRLEAGDFEAGQVVQIRRMTLIK